MATRTIKLLGKAYAHSGNTSIVVNFNNTEVFNGEVTTANIETPERTEAVDTAEVCSWTISTDDIGSFPLTISVSGGDFAFYNLQGNYTGYEATYDPDSGNLVSIETAPEDSWGDMNTNSAASDGKDNVNFSGAVDGQPPVRSIVNAENGEGDWVYHITDGVTFSCNYTIEADHTVISPVANIYS